MDNLSKIHQWLKAIEAQCVAPLAGTPKFIAEKQVFEYEIVSVQVVAYLKAVRAVQSLTSVRLLCANGLFIDFYTIGRCIFDCCNEIAFLLEGYPSVSPKQEQFLKNFQEGTIDGFLDKKTHEVSNKDIRNSSARRFGKILNFDHAKGKTDRVYTTFSGSVHSGYSDIMQIYGGPTGQQEFQISGVPNGQQKILHSQWIIEMDRMTMHTLARMAKNFGCDDLVDEISEHFSP